MSLISNMDSKATIEELKWIVKRFCDDRDWAQFHSPKDLAIGISTEASELLEIFRFKSEKEIIEILKGPRRIKVSEELVDVLYFVLRFAEMNNIDLSEELGKKIGKNAEKYPVEKSKGSNKKYTEF